jgi:hypothetical protein
MTAKKRKPDVVVRWTYYAGRGGDLKSVMLLTSDEWATLKQAAKDKAEVYLGEVCGKHSEVTALLRSEQFEVLTREPSEVAVVQKVIGDGSGLNIYRHLTKEEEA